MWTQPRSGSAPPEVAQRPQRRQVDANFAHPRQKSRQPSQRARQLAFAGMLAANIIADLTDKLGEWASNWWFLGVIFAISFLDSLVPIVPSETSVIVGGVAVGTGEAKYAIWMVVIVAAVGAFLGDNTSYSVGRTFAPAFERRAERKPKFAKRLDWAREQIDERGGLLLITARFIPGGRTILTLASGITRQRRTWFMAWIAVAVAIWATYAALLGRIGGKTFEDDHTKAFFFAFGLALSATLIIEVVRHLMKSRSKAAT
jgi:membrane protein DedA with SNARE-associated domain